MIIDWKREFVYIKITRSASTSIERWLISACDYNFQYKFNNKNSYDERVSPGMISSEVFISPIPGNIWTDNKQTRGTIYHPHCRFQSLIDMFPIIRNFKIIMGMRHPLDRLVSKWGMIMKGFGVEGGRDAKVIKNVAENTYGISGVEFDPNVESFREWFRQILKNEHFKEMDRKTWYISDLNKLDIFWVRFHNLYNDLNKLKNILKIQKQVDIPFYSQQGINKKHTKESEIIFRYKNYYTDEDIKLAQSYFDVEFSLFDSFK